MHTSREQRWNGSLIMCREQEKEQKEENYYLELLRHGWSGNWRKVQHMWQIIRMHHVQCYLTLIHWSGMMRFWKNWIFQNVCYRNQNHQAASTERQIRLILEVRSQSQEQQEISSQLYSARHVSMQEKQRIHTEQDVSFWWIQEKSRYFLKMVWLRPLHGD